MPSRRTVLGAATHTSPLSNIVFHCCRTHITMETNMSPTTTAATSKTMVPYGTTDVYWRLAIIDTKGCTPLLRLLSRAGGDGFKVFRKCTCTGTT